MYLKNIQTRLKQIGTREDHDVPMAETLLLLGALIYSEEIDLDPYRTHIEELHHALALEIQNHPQGNENLLNWRLNRLNAVLLDQFGYHGDFNQDNYDDPDKINMLDVIDRRSGIPVAIGVLYIELCERQKWAVSGLNFPGHFLLRLEDGAHRNIVDPFHSGEEMDAGKLRQLLKNILGPKAELHHDYYTAVTHRDVILRFCNNRKTRLITQGDYARAFQNITYEMWIAPNEPRLWFEAGVICIKLERLIQAIDFLKEFVQSSSDVKTISEAQSMIRALQRQLT